MDNVSDDTLPCQDVRRSSLTFGSSVRMVILVQPESPQLARILDQSDAAILGELNRLITERSRLVAPLDDRIAKLRSILSANKTLPLIGTEDAVSEVDSNRVISADYSDGPDRPRGEIQSLIYDYLIGHPEAGYAEIIDAVYGEVSPQNHNAARNAIAALKAGGWISGERGHWTIERRPAQQ